MCIEYIGIISVLLLCYTKTGYCDAKFKLFTISSLGGIVDGIPYCTSY